MPHSGDRDGRKEGGGWHRLVLVLSTEKHALSEGGEPGISQDEIVAAFFRKLVEGLGPEGRRLPPKMALAEALTFHAALYLQSKGWPKDGGDES